MVRQGPDLAIERLHPEFAKRLAGAIQSARRVGLTEAGIFSAYRPPVFEVGGFADKYYSLHAYGLAVDMAGIGRPGSPEAQQWHEIAAGYGIVCPYGYRNRMEWNHCQPTHLTVRKVGKSVAGDHRRIRTDRREAHVRSREPVHRRCSNRDRDCCRGPHGGSCQCQRQSSESPAASPEQSIDRTARSSLERNAGSLTAAPIAKQVGAAIQD